jgi:hypothetical protein
VASTSASVRRPLPLRFLKVAVNRSDSELNTGRKLLSSREAAGAPRSAPRAAARPGVAGQCPRLATPGGAGPAPADAPGRRRPVPSRWRGPAVGAGGVRAPSRRARPCARARPGARR